MYGATPDNCRCSASRSGGSGPGPRTGGEVARPANLLRDPVFNVPSDVAVRWNARVLDPASAVQVDDSAAPDTTVYVADRLVVSAAADDELRTRLDA